MIKKLLFALVIFPNLLFGSEKEARKLFVEADVLANEAGCNLADIKQNLADIGYISFSNNITSMTDNYPYTDTIDGILLISKQIEDFQVCWNVYKNIVHPKHLKIITEFSDTEVAYNLIANQNFIYEEDIKKFDNILETMSKALNNFLSNLDKDIITEIENSNTTEMSDIEMNKLANQLLGCLSPRLGVDYNKKKKVVVNILMNRDRTVRRTQIVGKSRLIEDDPTIKVINDIALSALRHPDCQFLNLPVGKYSAWKEINFTFDFSSILFD